MRANRQRLHLFVGLLGKFLASCTPQRCQDLGINTAMTLIISFVGHVRPKAGIIRHSLI